MSQSELGVRRGTPTDRAIRKRIEQLNDSLITDFTKDSKDICKPEVKRKRSSLEEEFERPEVQALLRKYNPKSTDFSEFEESSVSEDIRSQYRNRVEPNYNKQRLTSIDQSSSGYQSELPPSPPDTNRTPDSWQDSMTSHSRERSMDSDGTEAKPMLDRNRFSGKELERPRETVSPRVSPREGSRFTQNRLSTNTLDELDSGNTSRKEDSKLSPRDAPSRLSPRVTSSSIGTKPNDINNTDRPSFRNSTSASRPGDKIEDMGSGDEFINHRTRRDRSPRSLSPKPPEPTDTFVSHRTHSDRAATSPRSKQHEDDFVTHRTRQERTARPRSSEPVEGNDDFVTHRTRQERTARPRSPEPVEENDDFVTHRTRQGRTATSPRSTQPQEEKNDFVSHRTRPRSATSPKEDRIEPKLEVKNYNAPKLDEPRRSPLKTEPPKKFTPSKIEPAKKFTPVKFEPSTLDGTRSLPANYRSDPPRFDRPSSPVNHSSPNSKSPKFGVLNSPSRAPPRRPLNPREYAVTNAAVHRLQDTTPRIVEPNDSHDESQPDGPQPVFNENSLGIDLYASRIAMGQKTKAPSECSERSSRLDPQTYQSYTAGLLHSTRKSDRFLRMHKFYSNIERVTELEQELGKSPSGPCDRKIKQIKQKDKEIQSELSEVVDDIIHAQKKDKFVHDLGKLEKFQWNPNRERGLLNRPKSLGDLKKVFENESEPMNTSFNRKNPGQEEPIQKRQLSFDKLKEKYANEDSAEDKNSIQKSPVERGLVQRSKSVEPAVQRPVERAPVQLAERAPVQRSAERAPFQRSVERTPVQSSMERAPVQRTVEREPFQRSVERTPVQRPMEREPFQRSVERTPVQRPMEREPFQRSVERSSVQRPMEREPFQRPVERAVQRPVEREPFQRSVERTPVQSAERTYVQRPDDNSPVPRSAERKSFDRKPSDKKPAERSSRNRYEVHVGTRESDSSSSESGLHVRSISTPHETSPKQQPVLQHSNSYKQSKFGPKEELGRKMSSSDHSREIENYFIPEPVGGVWQDPSQDRSRDPVPRRMNETFSPVKHDDSMSSRNETLESSQEEKPVPELRKFAVAKQYWANVNDTKTDEPKIAAEPEQGLRKFAVAKQYWANVNDNKDEPKREVEPEQGLRKFAAAKQYWNNASPSKDNITKSYVKDQTTPLYRPTPERKLSGNLGNDEDRRFPAPSRVADRPLKASSPVTTSNLQPRITDMSSLSPSSARRTEPPKRWSPKPVERKASPYDHLRRGAPHDEPSSPARSPFEEKQEITSRWVTESVQQNDESEMNDTVEEIPFRRRFPSAGVTLAQNNVPDPSVATKPVPKRIEHRAMSTSALTEQTVDPEYGKLGKWSKFNVSRDLDKDVAELTEGNLQKWSAMDLRQQSFDTESQDTMIVKDVNENEQQSFVQDKLNSAQDAKYSNRMKPVDEDYVRKDNYRSDMAGVQDHRRFESGYSSASTKSPDSPRGLNSAKSVPDIRSEWGPGHNGNDRESALQLRHRDVKPRPVSDYEGWQNAPQIFATSPGAPARPVSPQWPKTSRQSQEPREQRGIPKSYSRGDGWMAPAQSRYPGNQAPHHHFSTSDLPRTSPSVEGPQDRRRRDEEDARRKHYLNILNEENKRKRGEEERRSLEQRRHNDYFLPKQKSPIPEDRFDGLLPPRLDKKHKPLEIRGKARAVYSFKAQNVKELSFRKNDVIYLLRRIDNNWYEAERHGMRGIVPVNYIEVVKSIEEAHNLAQKAEGTAAVKFKFRKQNPIELDADKGDVVRLVRRVDDNWYEARLNNKQGIIPASYLNVNNEPDTPFITPAPSVIGSVIHSTVTTPGPGTPVRPLSPLVPDPLSPPEWDFTKFYLPGMPVQREPSRDTSRDNTLRKHHTLPRDFISPEVVQRDFTSPPRNRYHSESSLGAGNDESRDSRYSTLDSRRVPGDEYGRPEYGARVQDTRRHDYHDVMEARGDEPLKAYRVLFNYIPQNDDELDIREGDHVYVLERCDDGWFVGTSTRTGQFGTFPGNYVQPV